jgi:hypothetical protein
MFVCLFVYMGVRGKPRMYCSMLAYLPPALDVPTLATRCPRAYRRFPHTSGGSWNLWAENKDRLFCLNADFHCTCKVLLHAANLRHGPTALLPAEGRRAEDFSALKNPTASAGFEPANLGTRGQHANS